METLKLIRLWRPGPGDPAAPAQEEPHGSEEVVEPESLSSEEVHGGEEASQSVPDSPNPSEDGEQEGGPQVSEAAGGQQPDFEEDSEGLEGSEEDFFEEGEEDSEDFEDFEEDCEDFEGDARRKPESERNQKQAFEIALEELRLRRLQRAFATIVAKVAEDAASLPTEGDDEWDVAAIMRRRLDRRPLWQCRQSRERERVVVILDTSGSCYDQAQFFRRIANLAARLGDAEVYLAPNACLESRLAGGVWQHVPHGSHWPFRRRVVLFFGDFDGGDSVVEAARENRVYWFSCEGGRYQDMTEHSWCQYSLAEFRGTYFECETDDDVIRLARKVHA